MVTETANPSAQPEKPPPPAEAYHGVFGFFRHYQKQILYTAVMFALVTFSVTGAMIGWFNRFTNTAGPRPTIQVNGQRVSLEEEDQEYGRLLAHGLYRPTLVLPQLASDASDNDMVDVFAILRRVSLADGLDVADTEVDRAIEFARSAQGYESATKMALATGSPSLAQYRGVVREAMRIGNYVRLHVLAAAPSDQDVIDDLLEGEEKITLRVASFEAKKLEDELKKTGAITDDDLKKWLDGKDENWKAMNQVYDTARVSLQVGAVKFDAFDASQWAEELKSLSLTEDVLRRFYEEEKDRLFKVDVAKWNLEHKDKPEPPPPSYPFESANVQELTKQLAQVDEVMNSIRKRIFDQRNEAMKAQNDEQRKAADERNQAQMAFDEAKKKAAAAPTDEALQAEVAKKQEELEGPDGKGGKKAAFAAAEQAVQTAREAFDFKAAFAAATAGKGGFQPVTEVTGPYSAKELETKTGLGEWKLAAVATSMTAKGDINAMVARTEQACFLFRLTDLVAKPLKAWDDLKKLLTDAYWVEQANAQAKDKHKAMEDKLLELAKARIPDKVQELDGKRPVELEKRFADWLQATEKKLAKAEDQVRNTNPASQTHIAWDKEATTQRELLTKKDDKKKELETAVGKEIDEQIKQEAKKKFGEVLDAAATVVGFALRTLPPTLRNPNQADPRFSKHSEDAAVFLFGGGGAAKLKVGEATDVLEDASKRMWHVAVCDKVEPRTVADLTRREFANRRDMVTYIQTGSSSFLPIDFKTNRLNQALQQSFTRKALYKRYHWLDSQNREAPEEKVASAPAGK